MITHTDDFMIRRSILGTGAADLRSAVRVPTCGACALPLRHLADQRERSLAMQRNAMQSIGRRCQCWVVLVEHPSTAGV